MLVVAGFHDVICHELMLKQTYLNQCVPFDQQFQYFMDDTMSIYRLYIPHDPIILPQVRQGFVHRVYPRFTLCLPTSFHLCLYFAFCSLPCT